MSVEWHVQKMEGFPSSVISKDLIYSFVVAAL